MLCPPWLFSTTEALAKVVAKVVAKAGDNVEMKEGDHLSMVVGCLNRVSLKMKFIINK